MNPDITTRLLALPSLRRQAEVSAREALSIFLGEGPDDDQSWTIWGEMDNRGHDRAIDHHAVLLARMERPESQAWALRRIAEKLGWKIGDEAPRIFRFEDGFRDVLWRVGIGPDQDYTQVLGLPDPPFAIFCQPTHFVNAQNRHEVAGIAGTDRPEAIAAILLHLESR